MSETPKGPLRIELDDLPGLDDEAPGDAPTDATGDTAEAAQVLRLAAAAGGGSRLMRWFWRALGALISLAIGVWAWDFTTGLLARNAALGWVALALVGAVLAVLLALALREWAAIARLGRVEHLRAAVAAARAGAEMAAAEHAVQGIAALYAGRGDAAWGLQRLGEARGDIFDGPALLDLAETAVLGPLDAAARAEVEAAAARVATLTALIPMPALDVVTALLTNLRMIRRLAAVYGGRSGTIEAWRLTRAVIGHMAATGAVAVGDDLIGSALGHGLAAKLSRRFGEGVINGALTVRVGVIAMEMCRPMPFAALGRPARTAMLHRALTGVFRKS